MFRFEQEILNAAPAPLHPRIPSVSCSGSGKVDVLIDRVTHSYFKDIALAWKGGGYTKSNSHVGGNCLHNCCIVHCSVHTMLEYVSLSN